MLFLFDERKWTIGFSLGGVNCAVSKEKLQRRIGFASTALGAGLLTPWRSDLLG